MLVGKEYHMDRALIDSYKRFLDEGKTERECVSRTVELARAKGFVELCEKDSLQAGDRVYFVNRDKSLALFVIGRNRLEDGMNILGAHIDSPRLDLKMRPLFEKEGIVYLNTHYYGGIKKYQWVTMPLAIHGVVFRKDGTAALVEIGEDEEDTALCISDILPHIAQEQMKLSAGEFIKGEELDLVVGLTPEGKEDEKDRGRNAIMAILKERYDIDEDDFLSAELEVVPAGRARDMGLDRSMVLAYGQDDRVCAYTSLRAIIDMESVPERTACCLLVDKEEIGSVGATGMDSLLLENITAEVLAKCGEKDAISIRRCLRNSYMLSSDVNSAYDPQHADLYDRANSSALSGGVVFSKYTGSRGKGGASDADPEFIAKLRKVLDENKVRFQMAELAKVDVGGGGTIAKYCAWYGMEVIDCGVAVLSMHAPFEITSAEDITSAYECYRAFLTL